jgi:hypothetical protein
MSILVKAKALYDKCGIDMNKDIATYAAHGYVWISPNSFLLAKPVNSKSETPPADQWNVEDADAWYVNMAVGCGVSEFINRIPYPLPLVGWMRQLKNQPVRWYDFKKIIRRK